jgi:hypothetical protein
MTNRPGNPIATDDMAPKPTDEAPKAPGSVPTDAPETEHIEEDGEPIGANFA